MKKYLFIFLFLIIAGFAKAQSTDAANDELNAAEPKKTATSINNTPLDYPGGLDKFYLSVKQNISYNGHPKGTVMVRFTINKDGSVSDFEIVSGLDSNTDEACIRAIKKCGNWKPEIQNGEPISSIYVVPIKF